MGEWHLNDPDQQPSPQAEHVDVWKNIENEDRDPRRVQVQQIWVYLEMHERERADGDPKVADAALQAAKTLYDKVRAKYPHFPPDLWRWLDNLKRELEASLPH
jgi:hypothetical protein